MKTVTVALWAWNQQCIATSSLSHCSPGINIDNNVVLVVAEAQMSPSRETQPTPFSLQEETQMSKCVTDRLVSVVSIMVVLYCSSRAVSYQN